MLGKNVAASDNYTNCGSNASVSGSNPFSCSNHSAADFWVSFIVEKMSAFSNSLGNFIQMIHTMISFLWSAEK